MSRIPPGEIAYIKYRAKLETLAELVKQDILFMTDDTLMAHNIENEWVPLDYDEELLNDLRNQIYK